MPTYNTIPTKDQWKKDLGLRLGLFSKVSPFPAVQRLGKLMDIFHSASDGAIRAEVAFHIYLHVSHVIKVMSKGDNKDHKKKLGGTLSPEQVEAAGELFNVVEDWLSAYLGVSNAAALEKGCLEYFGRSVNKESKEHDAILIVEQNALQFYTTEADRKRFKVSFRGGLAYQWEIANGNKTSEALYDTAEQGDAIEDGGSLFVMDGKGRMFALGKGGMFEGDFIKDLKHSSLLGGESVLMAGMIRFEKGKLAWLSAKSGHYQPTMKQMISCLERLVSYKVKLKGVKVYRENQNLEFDFKKGQIHPGAESCDAEALLKARGWPGDDKKTADLMFVPLPQDS